MFHLQRVLPLLLVSIILIITNNLLSAPAPPPKDRTEQKSLLGVWYVKDTGYLEVWEFKPNGIWQCYTTLDSYKYDSVCHKGTWEIEHKTYLYITYGQMHITHKLGSGVARKYDSKGGYAWSDKPLIFVKRVAKGDSK